MPDIFSGNTEWGATERHERCDVQISPTPQSVQDPLLTFAIPLAVLDIAFPKDSYAKEPSYSKTPSAQTS